MAWRHAEFGGYSGQAEARVRKAALDECLDTRQACARPVGLLVVNGASSLHSAGATGGTINFVTRRGQSETPKVTVRTGARAHARNIGN